MQTAGEVAEFTLKAVVVGVVLGIVFGAANAYLGLRVGMTVSASIPAAVMTVAVFRLLRSRGTILEANLSQTVGSASTSLATGTIFTIPALFLWGRCRRTCRWWRSSFLGALLGIAAMVPLRRLLIVKAHDELPYPEGTACAEVLRATTREGAARPSASAWIFRGMAVGAGVKLLISLVYLIPGEIALALPVLPKAELALEIAPALLGVGYILGYRQSAVCVAGALISALVITPLIAWMGASLTRRCTRRRTRLVVDMSAGDIWSRYVRYIGAGAVATAGILTVLRGLPTMVGAFAAVARGMQDSDAPGGRRLGAHRPRPARRLRVRRRGARGAGRRPRARRLRRRDERRAARDARARASASSACCSSPWRRASSASSACRRNPPRASRWSRCSARRRSSPPPAGSTPARAPAC